MCSPTSALSKVDLPALGRPMSAANPDLCLSVISHQKHEIALGLGPRRRRNFGDVGLLVLRLRRPLNPDARDATFVGLDHFEAQSAEAYLFADRGQVAELVDDQSGDRGEIVGGQLDVEPALDFADLHIAARDDAFGLLDDVGLVGARLRLVFVLDLPDDLLDQVFDGDQTGQPAVFIDDDGHRRLGLLHLGQQLVDRLGFGHEVSRAGDVDAAAVRFAELPVFQQVAHVDHALDVIHLAAVNWQTRIFRLDHQVAHGFERRAGLDGDDVRARRHHLPGGTVAEADDRLNQLAFILLDDAFFFTHVEQRLQFDVFAALLLGLGRRGDFGLALLAPKRAVDEVRDETEHGPQQLQRESQLEQRTRRVVLGGDHRQYLPEQDDRQDHSGERHRQEMLGVELIRYRADQDRDRGDRNVNAEREREAKLLVVGDDRTPEFGVTRPVAFAGQQSQADVAEFIEGAFCGGGNDQHQNKDAGQSYFGFHSCWRPATAAGFI